MDQREVNLNYRTAIKTGNTNQGLRVLARIIARKLVIHRLGVKRQYPSDSGELYIPEILGDDTN